MNKRPGKYLIWIFLLLLPCFVFAKGEPGVRYVEARPKYGDGALNLLLRYLLPGDDAIVDKFKHLNKGKFQKNGGLLLSHKYLLPIRILEIRLCQKPGPYRRFLR